MNPNPRVFACGHWIVDIGKRIDRWPEAQTLCLIDHVVSSNGGAAFNLACDLVRLKPGIAVEGIGRIGDDESGRFIEETCRSLGIGTCGLIVTPGEATSFTDVMTEAGSGRRTFFHAPGANTRLAENDLAGLWETMQAGDIFFLGYLGMLPSMDQLDHNSTNGASRCFQQARARGLTTVADLVSVPNPELQAQVRASLPHLDILFTNEIEASALTGIPLPEDPLDQKTAAGLASSVLSMGSTGIVVLHHSAGAVCAGVRDFRQPSVRVPAEEISGSSGAGDAFAAGFLTARMQGADVPECLEAAVCAAAVSLGSLTCSDALIPLPECLSRGKSRGFLTS